MKSKNGIKPEVLCMIQDFQKQLKIMIFFQNQYELGSGRYGRCFIGFNNNTNKLVAVKQIKRDHNNLDIYNREIENLTRATQNKEQSNLVKVYPYKLSSQNSFYIVMDYCQNQTLHNFQLRRGKRYIKMTEFLQIMLDIVGGEKELRAVNIVHNDLKPENIFIKNKTFMIGDFGLSIRINKQQHPSRGGTKPYNAPEKYTNSYIDHKSDIYAIGVILYEIYYGQHPYYNDSEYKIFKDNQLDKLRIKSPELFTSLPEKRNPLNFKLQQIFVNFLKSRTLKENKMVLRNNLQDAYIHSQIQKLLKNMVSLKVQDRPSLNAINSKILQLDIWSKVDRNTLFPEFGVGLEEKFQLPSTIILEQKIEVYMQSLNITVSQLQNCQSYKLQSIHNSLKDSLDKCFLLIQTIKKLEQSEQKNVWNFVELQFLLHDELYTEVTSSLHQTYQKMEDLSKNQLDYFYSSGEGNLLQSLQKNQNYLFSTTFLLQIQRKNHSPQNLPNFISQYLSQIIIHQYNYELINCLLILWKFYGKKTIMPKDIYQELIIKEVEGNKKIKTIALRLQQFGFKNMING